MLLGVFFCVSRVSAKNKYSFGGGIGKTGNSRSADKNNRGGVAPISYIRQTAFPQLTGAWR